MLYCRSIFSKYWTGHCSEWSRTCEKPSKLTSCSRIINLLLPKLAGDHTGRISALGLFCFFAALGPYCQDLGSILGTLSSGNADGDGDAETCEKIGERAPLLWVFINIKQHRRKPRFLYCQAYWRYCFASSVYQDDFIERSSQSTLD